MKKYLIRSGMLPSESFDDLEFLSRDRFGSNNGNLIYQYSVIRTLQTNDITFFSDNYSTDPSKFEEINKNYDAYILPFADAFREEFIKDLERYTELIRKLDIPVIVIGIGVRAPLEYDVSKGFSFDQEVKEFISAVLEKSSIVGLRGQITADYLSYLGFKAEKDFTVIGCPSMYAFGEEINIRKPKLSPESIVSINISPNATKESILFLENVSKNYKNYFFIPQDYNEFLINYFGIGEVKDVINEYPRNIASQFYSEGRVKYFLNAPTWFTFMQTVDLSIGTRLHGNIVATINGVPSITIINDSRMRELADYHSLPSITIEEITSQTKLEKLLKEVNFEAVSEIQIKNFDHYIHFLEKNELNHIYQEEQIISETAIDKNILTKKYYEPVETISIVSKEEWERRFIVGYPIYLKRLTRLRNGQVRRLKEELTMKESESESLIVQNKSLRHELKSQEEELSKLLHVEKELSDDYSKKIIALEEKNFYLEKTLERKLISFVRKLSDKIASLKKNE